MICEALCGDLVLKYAIGGLPVSDTLLFVALVLKSPIGGFPWFMSIVFDDGAVVRL